MTNQTFKRSIIVSALAFCALAISLALVLGDASTKTAVVNGAFHAGETVINDQNLWGDN